MEYFFMYDDSYDRTLMRGILLENGFSEEFREIFGMKIPTYARGQTKVNLTSPSEGRIQIQEYDSIKNVLELKVKLKPDKVVNSNCEEITLD